MSPSRGGACEPMHCAIESCFSVGEKIRGFYSKANDLEASCSVDLSFGTRTSHIRCPCQAHCTVTEEDAGRSRVSLIG